MLVSVIHQHALTISIHLSPPSWTFLQPPTRSCLSRLSQSPSLSSLSNIPLAIYFTYGIICTLCYSILHALYPFFPPSLSPAVSTGLFIMVCFSFATLQIGSSGINIQYLFFSFWVTSLCTTGSRKNVVFLMMPLASEASKLQTEFPITEFHWSRYRTVTSPQVFRYITTGFPHFDLL